MPSKWETREEFTNGAIAGSIGAVAKYAFNEITQALGWTIYDNNATAINTVMEAAQGSLAYVLFGFVNAVLIGAFFGVIIAFLFTRILSRRHYVFKAAAFGAGLWLFNFGVMSKVFNYPPGLSTSLGDMVFMLASLILYALVTAYVLQRMGLITER